MKIIDMFTGKIYYNTEGEESFSVTTYFWENLKSKGLKYRSGGTRKYKKDEIRYSEELVLKLKDKNFESIFRDIADSGMGKAVMQGELPIDTVL